MNRLLALQEQKLLLRKELRKKIEGLAAEERLRASRKIQDKLLSHPRFQQATEILTYLSLESEVETRSFLEEALKRGKRIYAPRVDSKKNMFSIIEIKNLDGLKPGPYGIFEPPFDAKAVGNPKDLDLAVIPGIGFDLQGGRLGRGKGYFDRFLKEAAKAYKIGLAFECQIVKKIPREKNDILLDEIITG